MIKPEHFCTTAVSFLSFGSRFIFYQPKYIFIVQNKLEELLIKNADDNLFNAINPIQRAFWIMPLCQFNSWMQLNLKTIWWYLLPVPEWAYQLWYLCYYTQIYPFCHLTSWDYASMKICKYCSKRCWKICNFYAVLSCIFTLYSTLSTPLIKPNDTR